ncbi:MAG: DeoR/GlpR family DNA-binding transcription regulator, partial [Sporolactobacillus sp.]
DLVRFLDASESTIRRDLQELEARHLLRRLHGGASLIQPRNQEPDMKEKIAKNSQEKKEIACYAFQLIKENECLFLDAGTTTFELIPYLEGSNVTVVTNSPFHATALAAHNVDCYVIGGLLKPTTQAVVGSVALQTLSNFRFDKVFMGVNGIDPQMGFTTPDPEEAGVKRKAVELAAQTFVLADSSKFAEVSFCKMFELSQAIIITDTLPDSSSRAVRELTKVICTADEQDRYGHSN